MPKVKPIDVEKRRRIEEQSEVIAELLDVDAEEIMLDARYGVMLTPDQADALTAMVAVRPVMFRREFGGMAQPCAGCTRLTTMRETCNGRSWEYRCDNCTHQTVR